MLIGGYEASIYKIGVIKATSKTSDKKTNHSTRVLTKVFGQRFFINFLPNTSLFFLMV